jgi:UDP-N-acetylmuramate: L-alanyl-gamma-D-glutamyl-meso-diaminopimelate ligase
MDLSKYGREADFYEAIASFKGASKRLEKYEKNKVAYKDFAHSPNKVAATTKAVKQYPNRTLVACLECIPTAV